MQKPTGKSFPGQDFQGQNLQGQNFQGQASHRNDTSSEDLWRLAVSGAGIGVWDWDLASNQVYCSSEAMEIRGRGDGEMTVDLKDFLDLVHPSDLNDLRAGRSSVIEATQDHFDSEHRVRHIDGSWIWISERSSVIRDDKGKPMRLIGCDRDITGQKAQELDGNGSKTNQELREIGDRLNQVLKSASVGIWDWDPICDKLVWDDGTMQIFGVEPSRFRGTSEDWQNRLHPDDFERMTQTEYAKLLERGHISTEYRIIRDNGEIRHIYADQFLHRNERNEVRKISGLSMDVTERKKIEKALIESEDKFQRIAEHLPGVVYRYIVHPDGSDEIAYISSQIREIYELEPEDTVGDAKAMWSRIHVDDLEWVQREVANSADALTPLSCEYRLQLPTKGVRWVQTFARPVRAENGNLIWDGLVVDHTDRKSAELALQETQQQFQRMTENVPGMIFRYVLHPDSSHEVLYASSRSNDFFGLPAESAVQNVELIFERIHPDDLPQYQRAIAISAETLQEFKQKCRIVLDDRIIWVETTSRPERLANGDIVWDGITIDITHAKQAEMQLRLMNEELATATKMKDQFLANMSHEFRTPLNAILGMAEGLQGGLFGSVNAKQHASLDVVQQSGKHLLDVINEILDLATIESGQIKLERTDLDIKCLCESSLRFVASQADKKKVQLNLNVPWNLPKIFADEKRIRQVLINLLTNAVKFTPEGGNATLQVDRLLQEEPHEGDILRISVKDSGIGIEAERIDSVFDPFVQIDSSLNRGHDGTGLGLSLVKQFVELHGGQVTVTSESGAGSCFTVDLPYRQSNESEVCSKGAAEGQDLQLSFDSLGASEDETITCERVASTDDVDAKDSLPTILLAEDNDSVAKAVRWYLEALGYSVHRATDGAIAIDLALKLNPDVILMDIQMPNLDGLSAIKRIRQAPKISKIPIVALTGRATDDDFKRCMDAGANEFLVKPYPMEELVQVIEKFGKKDAVVGSAEKEI